MLSGVNDIGDLELVASLERAALTIVKKSVSKMIGEKPASKREKMKESFRWMWMWCHHVVVIAVVSVIEGAGVVVAAVVVVALVFVVVVDVVVVIACGFCCRRRSRCSYCR